MFFPLMGHSVFALSIFLTCNTGLNSAAGFQIKHNLGCLLKHSWEWNVLGLESICGGACMCAVCRNRYFMKMFLLQMLVQQSIQNLQFNEMKQPLGRKHLFIPSSQFQIYTYSTNWFQILTFPEAQVGWKHRFLQTSGGIAATALLASSIFRRRRHWNRMSSSGFKEWAILELGVVW